MYNLSDDTDPMTIFCPGVYTVTMILTLLAFAYKILK